MKEGRFFGKKGMRVLFKIVLLMTIICLSYFFIWIYPQRHETHLEKNDSIKGIKYLYDSTPWYVFVKKHYCPNCGTKLIVTYEDTIINSNAHEAKEYDFSFGDSYVKGNVKFRKGRFYCSACCKYISFQEMKTYEKRH